jgi:ATP-dependent Clp protease ATP-binding subunit ClpA
MRARRTVFWARREAGRSGSQTIDSEHLLLGLLMEDQAESEQYAVIRFGDDKTTVIRERGDPCEPFFSNETAGNLRRTLSEQTRPGTPVADTVDLPLTESAHRALAAAGEHAGNDGVQLLHVLWGLISDETSSVSKLLNVKGVTVGQVENAIHGRPRS